MLRTTIDEHGNSGFEPHKMKKLNTSNTATVDDFISETDPKRSRKRTLEQMCNRQSKGSKLEDTCSERKARVIDDSKITFLSDERKPVMV